MHRILFLALTAGFLAATPRIVAAQAGGYPVKTSVSTQFVFKDGEVMRRDGSQTTALTQNVKLANGTKINYKNGIVEMPADKVHPQGKKLTLREGDYVRADGGVVFATPGSAAAARGQGTITPGTKFETYTQRGPGYTVPAQQITILNRKIELLNQKIALLSQGRTDLPDTKAIDEQLALAEHELTAPK